MILVPRSGTYHTAVAIWKTWWYLKIVYIISGPDRIWSAVFLQEMKKTKLKEALIDFFCYMKLFLGNK